MGIKGFENFCKINTDRCFQSVTIRNEILVIDGSELFYHFYDACEGRAPLDQFREQAIKFYTNLRTCGIRPVIVFDGFKYGSNHEKVFNQAVKVIAEMEQFIKEEKIDGTNKLPFCRTILATVNQELGIPFVNGVGDMNSSTAAIANLLGAKVLASDTEYCVHNLSHGWLPVRYFKWNDDAEISRVGGITAKFYHIEHFSRQYNIPTNVVSYLDIFFGRKSYFPEGYFQSFVDQHFGV
uniref:XPG N-terminal domain-containing protein n=1 Tax=Ciona intestinalis TaxID=7719 RepID=F7BDQ8_CIOIN